MDKIEMQVRRFPVTVEDQRTGDVRKDFIILDKSQLQAAQIVGQSSTELIYRIFNRRGYRVLDIGKAVKRTLCVDLGELWTRSEREAGNDAD